MQTQTLAPVKLTQFDEKPGPMKEHDGWAALYDVEIDRGWYMMELAPKCFSKSTGEPNKILILNQHDSWQPIGRATEFEEKKEGLYMDFALNTEVQAGAEVDSNIRNGVLSGLSVGFDIIKVETEKRGGEGAKGYEVDRITEARLSEVSCVSFPAIDGARINASDSKGTVTTFAVTDGEPKRERLQAGDRVMLATYTVSNRIRPNPPAEETLDDDVKSDAELEKEPESKTDPEPQVIELTEDEKYPGAREALLKVIMRK